LTSPYVWHDPDHQAMQSARSRTLSSALASAVTDNDDGAGPGLGQHPPD
jgi:hypothetical protein